MNLISDSSIINCETRELRVFSFSDQAGITFHVNLIHSLLITLTENISLLLLCMNNNGYHSTDNIWCFHPQSDSHQINKTNQYMHTDKKDKKGESRKKEKNGETMHNL